MTQTEFEKKWRKTFVPRLTKERYVTCYLHQYLWHVFGYELIPKSDVLSGEAAIEAYDSIEKDGAMIIHITNNAIEAQVVPILDQLKQSKSVLKKQELYVVGKDWAWTFVSTHENGWCGPYFYRAPAKLTWRDYHQESRYQ